MKTNITSRRGQLSRARFNPLHAIAAAGLLLSGLCTATSRADQTLLGAPSANYSYYGMYSPYVTAASFTLATSYYVSTIDVVLRTPAASSFTTFHFSLQSALTDPSTIFASEDLTAPLGVASTQVMNVNETLLAGTYYLSGIVPGYAGTPATPGNVDGWMLSTGVYNGAAGTIANGVWVGSNPPIFDTGGVYVAPAFTVNGSAVPEPSTWAMLAAGTASLLALRRRKQA
jgi:PEP-CTERM motif